MRICAILLASLLVACGSPPAVPAAATVSSASPLTLLVSEGGVLRPIANGGRVALRDGWATVALAPSSAGEADLEVALFGADGRPVTGEVTCGYESMDMDHGMTTEHGVRQGDRYLMHLSFVMPGAWRLVLHVARSGVEETVTLVLPQAGL